jgi:D-hexose-6-phosphate mutarotase
LTPNQTSEFNLIASSLDPVLKTATLRVPMPDEIPNSPSYAQFTQGDLTMLRISGASSSMEIAHQGAHICGWQIHGKERVLFMSPNNRFTARKAIRGGVPVIFPWFGKKEGDPFPRCIR